MIRSYLLSLGSPQSISWIVFVASFSIISIVVYALFTYFDLLLRVRQLSLPHLCTGRFYVLETNLAGFYCRKGAPRCLIMNLAPGSSSKECCQVTFQFRPVLAVLGLKASSSIVIITMPIQLLSTISLYMLFTPYKMERKCICLLHQKLHMWFASIVIAMQSLLKMWP